MLLSTLYLKEPFQRVGNITVSKFSTNGERIWTSFVHGGEHLFSNNEELFITSSTLNKDSEDKLPLINAYQTIYNFLETQLGAVDCLKTFDNWTSESIKDRQEIMKNLGKDCWGKMSR